ncbi:hypothetical protein [Dyadobacter bucti]|uniref:hypothetical protein n=1 Tax=Dyadobacter bucti TaxID=2572203 RepID=UPI00110961D4|nr:hypothetical protein [Dyadobacter bucti]
MKTKQKSFIFAIVLGIVIFVAPKKSQAENTINELNNRTTVLANKSDSEFASYIGQVLPEFVKQENWSIIENIITLYQQTPSKLRVTDAGLIGKFSSAVADLGSKLEEVNTPESLELKKSLLKKAEAVKFITTFDLNTLSADQIENAAVKAPNSFVSL